MSRNIVGFMSSQAPTDDELMLAVQTGETRAFNQLVSRYQGPLMGFFVRQIHDVQQAEDLTQETLLRVYNQSWDYLPRGAFRGWLFRIARNLLVDNLRRRSSDALIHTIQPRQEEDELLQNMVGEIGSPEQVADIREVAALVDEFLKELPEEQRLTFILHHYNQLTLPEVADSLEANLPTTKSRLRLAKEKLRQKLQARGILEFPNLLTEAEGESRSQELA